MSSDPFYKDHWRNIDKDRMEKYQSMFLWSPSSASLYDPAEIGPGHKVADFGCGPGHTAVEMANWVGPNGHVFALDLNEDFITQARDLAKSAGVERRLTANETDGVRLPLEDMSLDRISARNAIMYVDDPVETLREFHRVLRPSGKMHAIEGDWYMMIVEPVPRTLWTRFVDAASHACRTADVGRKLYGFAKMAGFSEGMVMLAAPTDTEGSLLPMIQNMAKYARLSDKLDNEAIDEVIAIVDQSLSDGTYLAISPRFVVTAYK